MSTLRAAAQQALEALEAGVIFKLGWVPDCEDAITVLRAALAEPVQEPVAYIHRQGNHREVSERPLVDDEKARGWTEEPLYAAPPQRLPLTDEEATAIARVGPVYAPDGVVTRTPTAYRRELEQTRIDAIRRTEAAHGIRSKT